MGELDVSGFDGQIRRIKLEWERELPGRSAMLFPQTFLTVKDRFFDYAPPAFCREPIAAQGTRMEQTRDGIAGSVPSLRNPCDRDDPLALAHLCPLACASESRSLSSFFRERFVIHQAQHLALCKPFNLPSPTIRETVCPLTPNIRATSGKRTHELLR
jgi:hypothetical protein